MNRQITESPLIAAIKVSVLQIAALALIFLVFSGRFTDIYVYIFFGCYFILTVASYYVLTDKVPQTLYFRLKKNKLNVESWDKKVVFLYGSFLVLIFVISALEMRFFPKPDQLRFSFLISLVLLVFYKLIITQVILTNPFYETHVRFQSDRNQMVIDSGPYKYVRHPGYSASILLIISIVLAAESYYGLIPAVLFVANLIYRITREEKLLLEKLLNYDSYMESTKYRILPGIW
ncbi:methyltransferase family protein [Maribacter sp. 2-571]|uniref:methyltransferase family protein n=1 Tax=Maribacter sp. 2-571 TaxID=3417569 RepID=UPI003D330155